MAARKDEMCLCKGGNGNDLKEAVKEEYEWTR